MYSGTLKCDHLDYLTTLRKRPLFSHPVLVLPCWDEGNKRAGQKVSTVVGCPQRGCVHRMRFYCTCCWIPQCMSCRQWKCLMSIPPASLDPPHFLLIHAYIYQMITDWRLSHDGLINYRQNNAYSLISVYIYSQTHYINLLVFAFDTYLIEQVLNTAIHIHTLNVYSHITNFPGPSCLFPWHPYGPVN